MMSSEQNSEVSYFISEFHVPASSRGVRWDDPVFKVAWPTPILVMSEKDRRWPAFLMNGALSS
jgi:dTDP-4-dehydrorhamnose 3,5-epimerase